MNYYVLLYNSRINLKADSVNWADSVNLGRLGQFWADSVNVKTSTPSLCILFLMRN